MDYATHDESEYTLVAYRPNGADYCMSCLMASYDSDFEVHGFDSIEGLIEKMAELRAAPCELGQPEWELHLHVSGSAGLPDDFEDRLAEATRLKVDRRERAGHEARERARAEKDRALRERELAQLERLRAKYKETA